MFRDQTELRELSSHNQGGTHIPATCAWSIITRTSLWNILNSSREPLRSRVNHTLRSGCVACLVLLSAVLCAPAFCGPLFHCCPTPSTTFPASHLGSGGGDAFLKLWGGFNCVGEAVLKVQQLIGCKWVHLLWFGVAMSLQFSWSFYSFLSLYPHSALPPLGSIWNPDLPYILIKSLKFQRKNFLFLLISLTFQAIG